MWSNETLQDVFKDQNRVVDSVMKSARGARLWNLSRMPQAELQFDEAIAAIEAAKPGYLNAMIDGIAKADVGSAASAQLYKEARELSARWAVAYGRPLTEPEALDRAFGEDPELAAAVLGEEREARDRVLKDVRLAKLATAGRSGPAQAELHARVAELRKADPKLTEAGATDRIMEEDARLSRRVLEEGG